MTKPTKITAAEFKAIQAGNKTLAMVEAAICPKPPHLPQESSGGVKTDPRPVPTSGRPAVRARGWNNKRVGKAKNKLEAAWEAELDAQMKRGDIAWFGYEAVTFKLADDTRYTPDFVVMYADGRLQCHECKGSFWPDKNKVKFKVAREQLWFLDFMVVRKEAAKRGGAWKVTPI